MTKFGFLKRFGKAGEGAGKFSHFTSKFKNLKFIEKLKNFKKYAKEFEFLEKFKKLPSLNKLTNLAVIFGIFGIAYEANEGVENIEDAFTNPVFIGSFLTFIGLIVFAIYMVTRGEPSNGSQDGGGKLQSVDFICIFIGIIFLFLLLDILYELLIEFDRFCELEEQKEKLYQLDYQVTQNY